VVRQRIGKAHGSYMYSLKSVWSLHLSFCVFLLQGSRLFICYILYVNRNNIYYLLILWMLCLLVQVVCKYSNRDVYAYRLGKFSLFTYIGICLFPKKLQYWHCKDYFLQSLYIYWHFHIGFYSKTALIDLGLMKCLSVIYFHIGSLLFTGTSVVYFL
jgi:hypothetical protein